MNVREAMNRFRADRADTVQRLLTKVTVREQNRSTDGNTSTMPRSDPTGRLGSTIDLQA